MNDRRVLMLCRTRAAAQERLRAGDADVVWTLDEFFERLSVWGALVSGVRRDDALARVLAAQVLVVGSGTVPPASPERGGPGLPDDGHGAERPALRARLAPVLDSLRREIAHGQTTAAELLAALGDDGDVIDGGQGRRAEVGQLLGWVSVVEQAMSRAGIVCGARALLQGCTALNGGRRPGFLRGIRAVHVELPVDATTLQAATLSALASHVDVVVTLPFDPRTDRGALDGIDAVFRTFERSTGERELSLSTIDVVGEGPLAPLRRVLFSGDVVDGAEPVPAAVRVLPDVHAERSFAAGAAAARRALGGRVAVVARGDDALSDIVAALERHGVAVRRRRRRLTESPAARLLLDIIALRLDGAPRDRLLAALVNLARRNGLSGEQGAAILATLRRAAARRDVEDTTRPTGGYRHRLERLVLREPGAKDEVHHALARIEPLLGSAASLPLVAPLSAQCATLLAVIDQHVEQRGRLGGAEVREVVARLAGAVDRAGAQEVRAAALVDLHATQQILREELHAVPWLDDVVEVDDDAVEVLTLPELCGRRFAHVIVVGAVEGELPRAASTTGLLGDGDRMILNRVLGRRALRLVDDGGGGSGRGIGSEGAWWLLALRAAEHSLVLTAAARDERGREQAPSAWLLDAARALGTAPEAVLAAGRAGGDVEVAAAPRTLRIEQARALLDGAGGDTDPGLAGQVALFAQMSRERAHWFSFAPVDDDAVDSESLRAAFEARRGAFAFAVDGRRITRVFGSALGLRVERPLTPTRLEALASCRMHGFVQHVWKIDVDPEPGNAIEVRAAGTLAHNVLERFYRERRARRIPYARMNAEDRARLSAIVDEEAAPLLAGSATGHLAAVAASVAFLKTSLVRVVTRLARRPPVLDVEPAGFEWQIGATQGGRPPEWGSVPVTIAPGRTIWLGGVIDRVDEGPGGRVVVDYKSTNGAGVRRKASARELFASHFQLPLYLRLLEHHRPTSSSTALHGYLVSLKDGTLSTDIGDLPELRERVLDDDRVDGLGQAIGRVVLPILHGTLPPDAGARCEECRLQRVCRVPLESVVGSRTETGTDGEFESGNAP